MRQRLGLDALLLLRKPDNRVVFLAAALFAIPLAAFYPYTPPHLRELGLVHTTAWISVGQVTEIAAMFGLAGLLARWRFKWILVVGLALGVVRFALCTLDSRTWLLIGVSLHGCSFTLVFITAQIYIDERVEREWRVRAQALLSLMMSGLGNLLGYLGTGAWFHACAASGPTQWRLFWGGIAVAVFLVLAYFLLAYRGIGSGLIRPQPPNPTV
jgi:MFS family permease